MGKGQGPYSADYRGLFTEEAAWRTGAGEVRVFGVSAQFVLSGSDDLIRSAFQDMERRHIKIAIQMGMVPRLDSCGLGEGYAPVGMSEQIARRLHGLGLHLDFIDSDESVFFTHEITWGTAKASRPNCMYPLKTVADRVALSLAAVRKYYPAVQLGMTEPLGGDSEHGTPQHYIQDYAEAARLMEQTTGSKLAFFHVDLAWRTNPLPFLPALRQAIKSEAIPFGIILGGSPPQTTATEWVDMALSRLAILTRNPATRPDEVVIASWQPLPTQVLPETAPGTYTNWLLRSERMLAAEHR